MKLKVLVCSFLLSGIASNAFAVDGLEVRDQGAWKPAQSIYANGSNALPLCARYNNYFCVKKPGAETWDGQIRTDGKNHAIFGDPLMSARAFFRLMRTYRFKHGLVSANDIFGRYAPASDCIGSVDRNPATGKCPDGENPTWVYAARVASSLGLMPTDDLNLFTSGTTLDRKVARTLAREVSRFELGNRFRISDEAIDQGVERARFTYSN